jgi:hypothetical protein
MIMIVVAPMFLKLLQYHWNTTWFLVVHPDMSEGLWRAANYQLDEREFPCIKPLADLLDGTSGLARDLGLLSANG